MSYLIAVRHGERLDKADEELWKSIVAETGLTGPTAVYFSQDPPLTALGYNQASEMARNVNAEAGKTRKPIRVYSSRLLRSVGTAVEIAKFTNSPVYLSSGLSMVIPEVKRANGLFMFKSVTELNEKFPGIIFVDCDVAGPDNIPCSSWPKAFKAIVADDTRLSIIVGHGETLKSLVGSKVKTPYCCYGLFNKKAPSRISNAASRTIGESICDKLDLVGIKDHSGRFVSQVSR